MLTSEEPAQIISGAIVFALMLTPFLPALFQRLRRGKWASKRQPTFELSPARLADAGALSALAMPALNWRELLTPGKGAIVCLRGNQVILGAAVAQCNDDRTADILAVYVDPPWRRQYWGSRLLAALQTQLQDEGIGSVRVTVPTDDCPSRQFWANQGWAVTTQALTTSCQPKPAVHRVASATQFLRRWRRSMPTN